MNEDNFAIARKVVLCAGLPAAALLIIYPHWLLRVHPGNGSLPVDQDIGRAFIASPTVFTVNRV